MIIIKIYIDVSSTAPESVGHPNHYANLGCVCSRIWPAVGGLITLSWTPMVVMMALAGMREDGTIFQV